MINMSKAWVKNNSS